MYGYIYVLTSPSGKHYVGQTWNLENRFNYYKKINYKLKNQPKIYNAILKYGPSAFTYEMVDICYEQDELNDAEIYWIKYYDSIKNGYNCMSGGQNGTHSEETRKKLSQSHKGVPWSARQHEGRKNSFYVFKPTKEHLHKLHQGRASQKIYGMAGKKQSEKQKELVSSLMKNVPKTEQHKKRLSEAKIKYKYVLISPTGKRFETNNLKSFCDQHNLNNGNMAQCVRKGKYCKGWKGKQIPIVPTQ